MGSKNDLYGRDYYESIFRYQVRNSQRNRSRLELILAHQSRGRLLELGCGKGELLRLAARHFDVEGIDISAHAIQALRQSSDLNVRQADVENSSLPETAYDVVAAFNMLEHLAHPEKVLRKIAAALRPGGCVVGSMPYNAAVLGRLHTALSNLFDRTHVSTFPPQRWERLFEQAGFHQLEFFGEIMLGKNLCRYVRFPHWNLLAFNLVFVGKK